jgi:hypothetical protein
MPFLLFWLLLATLLAPVFVRLAAKGDPVWAAARRREQGRQRGPAAAGTGRTSPSGRSAAGASGSS